MQPQVWQQLNLQQKSFFHEMVNRFSDQCLPGGCSWELFFAFLLRLDSKTLTLFHPMTVYRAFSWAAKYYERGLIANKRFARRAKATLSNFIPIFFAETVAQPAGDHKEMMSIVERVGSGREYRLLLNLMATRYENQAKKTTLRPKGFLEHEEVQRMYLRLSTFNDTKSFDIVERIANISKHVIIRCSI